MSELSRLLGLLVLCLANPNPSVAVVVAEWRITVFAGCRTERHLERFSSAFWGTGKVENRDVGLGFPGPLTLETAFIE